MNKTDLTLLYNLYTEINKTEKKIVNSDFMEGGFIIFEDLRKKFWDLYRTYDSDEFSTLERLLSIIDNMCIYDTKLLKEEDKKKFSVKYRNGNIDLSDDGIEIEAEAESSSEGIFITKEFREKCGYCKIEFKNVEEVIDYVLDYETSV